MVVGNSAGFALGSLKSHPPTMSLTHCTTEREAKYSKLGHICLHTKVPTLLYDVALGALSFHVAIWRHGKDPAPKRTTGDWVSVKNYHQNWRIEL